MLDHVTIGVSNIERSKSFYDAAFRPLGIESLYAEGETFAGYGLNKKPFSGLAFVHRS
jgi:catechol 2,3-dioxygenase-like lactoylglutathione lyase family enzyme